MHIIDCMLMNKGCNFHIALKIKIDKLCGIKIVIFKVLGEF